MHGEFNTLEIVEADQWISPLKMIGVEEIVPTVVKKRRITTCLMKMIDRFRLSKKWKLAVSGIAVR